MRAVTKSKKPIIFNIISAEFSGRYLSFADRKGFEFYLHWVEIFFIVLLVFGIFLANFIRNEFLNYGIVFISGFIIGKVIHHHRRKDMLFPYILISIGFIAGYILGTSASKTIVLIFFILGNFMSMYLCEKGFL